LWRLLIEPTDGIEKREVPRKTDELMLPGEDVSFDLVLQRGCEDFYGKYPGMVSELDFGTSKSDDPKKSPQPNVLTLSHGRCLAQPLEHYFPRKKCLAYNELHNCPAQLVLNADFRGASRRSMMLPQVGDERCKLLESNSVLLERGVVSEEHEAWLEQSQDVLSSLVRHGTVSTARLIA
jgi:hypothetical protein